MGLSAGSGAGVRLGQEMVQVVLEQWLAMSSALLAQQLPPVSKFGGGTGAEGDKEANTKETGRI